MLDRFTLALVQFLCKEYGWRFNSSDIQIRNGTVSVIVKGEVYEISNDLQVRRRRLSISPSPYSKSGVYVMKKLCNQGNYIKALKVLHDKLGDDVITNDIKYFIYYKTNLDSDYEVFEYNGLEIAKSIFHQIIINFNIANVQPYNHRYMTMACVILQEKYGKYSRIIDIRNVFDSAKNITDMLETHSKENIL